jgi:hypothetical protein
MKTFYLGVGENYPASEDLWLSTGFKEKIVIFNVGANISKKEQNGTLLGKLFSPSIPDGNPHFSPNT